MHPIARLKRPIYALKVLLTSLIGRDLGIFRSAWCLLYNGPHQGHSSPWWTWGLLFYEAGGVCSKAWSLSRTGYTSTRRLADVMLSLATVDAPVFHTLCTLGLPGYLDSKNFFVNHLFVTALASLFLPLPHAIVTWTFNTPIYLWV